MPAAHPASAVAPVLGWTPPQGWPAALTEHLGMELWRVPVVVISALGIYLTALLLLRVFGARLITGLSVFDTVVALMFGAVAGRVILGHPPTLAAGVVGLTTLAVLEAVILEASSRLSVIRAGEPIDLDLLGDAIGSEHLHDDAD